MRIHLLVLALVALAGCAGTYTEPSLPADHPANSAAMEAPATTRSLTLDLATAEPVAAPAQGAMEHMGRGMDRHAEPKPAKPNAGGEHKHGGTEPATGGDAVSGPGGGAVLYACPMHPEVTSDKPDQRCPKCGMKLRKQEGSRP